MSGWHDHPLDDDTVAVWWSDSFAGDTALRLLSAEERGRHDAYRRPADRLRCATGVTLTRLVVGGLLGLEVEPLPGCSVDALRGEILSPVGRRRPIAPDAAGLLRTWVGKKAVLKALGTGLATHDPCTHPGWATREWSSRSWTP